MTRADDTTRRTDRVTWQEGGYAIILTALILVPLFGFAGFAVDVGAWYARASAIQKAADAAALAGVVWQPDLATATAVAQAEAAKNGFVDGVDGVTVTVTDIGQNQLEVEITDDQVDLFFSSLFLDTVTITRQATAEYVLAVPMGSPKNYIGTDWLVSSDPENFVLAINGGCAPKEWGDPLASNLDLTYDAGGTGWTCPHSLGGPGPDPSGTGYGVVNATNVEPWSYAFYIDVPAGLSAPVDLYILSPAFDGRVGTIDNDYSFDIDPYFDITTTWRIRAPDATPLDDNDNPLYACTSGRAAGSGIVTYPDNDPGGSITLFPGDTGDWEKFCTISAASPGRYILEVATEDLEPNSFAHNRFALLARAQGGPLTCDTRVDALCPSVVAKEWLSIWADLGGNAEFYLAEVGDQHQGKTMRVTLFDPGEGSQGIQILDPLGNPVNFTWQTSDGLDSGSGNYLDVSGTTSPPPGQASASYFNNRFVEIDVSLPTDFTAAYGSARWWKVRYVTGSAPEDRTTWSVQIRGDPVRLVE